MSQSKTCSRCKQTFNADNFAKDRSKKSGLSSACKLCLRERDKKYRLENCEKYLLKAKTYRDKNKEICNQRTKNWQQQNKQKAYETAKKWRQSNKEKVKEYDRRYRQKLTKEQRREERQKYLQKNPNYYLDGNYQRRMRVNQQRFKVSKKEITKLKSQSCFYCQSQEKIVIDHVIPLSRGGSHSVGNLVSACQKCNLSKYNKFITEWKYYA